MIASTSRVFNQNEILSLPFSLDGDSANTDAAATTGEGAVCC
jgi:hypothetical protein